MFTFHSFEIQSRLPNELTLLEKTQLENIQTDWVFVCACVLCIHTWWLAELEFIDNKYNRTEKKKTTAKTKTNAPFHFAAVRMRRHKSG